MKFRTILSIFALLTFVAACGGGNDNNEPPEDPPLTQTATACTNTAQDSPAGPRANRISSHDKGPSTTYHQIAGVREDVFGTPFNIDYMVHNPAIGNTPIALLVLIQGGNGDANITGVDGGSPTSSGGNFLVRSAHLYAAKNYKVVTIDQPSDYNPDTTKPTYNLYRASIDHSVDLSTIINAERGNLPVIIAGTSRGAISAVAQHRLSDAIAISSTVTNDGRTSAAVNETSSNPMLQPGSVTVPAHVMWHVDDACLASPVFGTEQLVNDFNPNAAYNAVSGGFDASDKLTNCKGHTVHGFYGIESCVVGLETSWMSGVSFSTTKPTANRVTSITTSGTTDVIDLSSELYTQANNAGALSYSLLFTTTTLGGTVSLDGSVITYTPPGGIASGTDHFVYLVDEVGGGSNHNVVEINIVTP